MIDLIGLINLITGVVQIGTSTVVLVLSGSNKMRRYYAIPSFFLGLWSLSIFFYTNPIIFETTIWLKIVYTVAYCMTLGLILFARVYPKDVGDKFKGFFIANLLYMTVMCFLVWRTDLIVVSTTYNSVLQNTSAQMGLLYALYGLPEFVTAIYIVWYYLKQTSILSGIEKRQVQFYVIGGIIMLIPVLLFDFVFPLLFDITSLYKYSTVGNVFWTILVGYSIFTTRFLDIRLVFGTFLSLVLKGLLILFCLVFTIFIMNPLGNMIFTMGDFLKLFALSIIFSVFLIHLFRRIDQLLDEKIIYSKYNPDEDLKKFVDDNSKILDSKVIAENLIDLVDKSFHPNFISIVMIDSSGDIILKEEKNAENIGYVKYVHKVLKAWKNLNSNRVLINSELRRGKKAGKRLIDNKVDKIASFMDKYSIEIMFPVKEIDKFDGMVMIGQNLDKGAYSVGDINFLENIIQNALLAFVRARLYSELNSFNDTLKEKVDERTQELSVKVSELEEARRKERDMVDIMGHELRTPATVVKLNADLLEKYTTQINQDRKLYKKYLSRIKNAINNEIDIINTLLSSAKLEGNKMTINSEEVELSSKIEECISSHERDASDKSLKLVNNVPKDIPNVYADKSRVLEILHNLVSNAIKYTEKGSVSIEGTYNNSNVTIKVIDTGIGISQRDLDRLGEKFYRVNNYTDDKGTDIVRPGGTGLGLYVTFNLVKNMGGSVKVTSELGKGSEFIFSLPRYTGQKSRVSGSSSDNMFERLGLQR